MGRLKMDLVEVARGSNFVCGLVWPPNADVCLFGSRRCFVAKIEGCENRDFDKFHFLAKNRRFYEMLIWSCSGPLNALKTPFSGFSGSIYPGALVWEKFAKFFLHRIFSIFEGPNPPKMVELKNSICAKFRQNCPIRAENFFWC